MQMTHCEKDCGHGCGHGVAAPVHEGRDPGGSGLRLMNNTQTQPDFPDPYKLRAGRLHAVAEGREKIVEPDRV